MNLTVLFTEEYRFPISSNYIEQRNRQLAGASLCSRWKEKMSVVIKKETWTAAGTMKGGSIFLWSPAHELSPRPEFPSFRLNFSSWDSFLLNETAQTDLILGYNCFFRGQRACSFAFLESVWLCIGRILDTHSNTQSKKSDVACQVERQVFTQLKARPTSPERGCVCAVSLELETMLCCPERKQEMAGFSTCTEEV